MSVCPRVILMSILMPIVTSLDDHFSTTVSYELSHITYVWKNDEDTLRKSPSLTTLNAYLIQNATTTCPIKASWRGKFTIKFIQTSILLLLLIRFNHIHFIMKMDDGISVAFFLSFRSNPFYMLSCVSVRARVCVCVGRTCYRHR